MKRKPRILFLLLAAAMMLSMVMPVAAAAPNISADAGFAGDVTLSGADSYEASLSVDLAGLDGFTGYELVVDWESLADYTSRVRYSANDEVRDANGSPKNYGAHDQLGTLEPCQRYLQIYGADTIANLTGVAIVNFTLNGSIPAGKYPVKVTVIDVIDGNAKPILDREDPSTYLTATGTLTVRNADGTVPDGPAEDTVYQISSSVDSDAGTGSVSFSKTEAKAGETITVTLDAATGHELDTITATNTTGGTTVDLTKVSDTEYTFTMPAGNVQVNVSYKLSGTTVDAYSVKIGAAVNGAVHTNGVKSAEAGETVTVFVKPNENYETVSVAVTAETGVKVTVSGGTDQVNGFYKYTFTMPESAVTVDAVFRSTSDSNKDEVSAGHILTKGTVLTSNNKPLAGAKVQLKYTDGAHKGSVAAETVTGADGTFVLDEVSGSYNYTLQAICDTGIQQGRPADPGFTVYSQSLNISRSAGNVSDKGEVISQTLTVTLYYEWDVDNDGSVERVFAGSDDTFLTADDFYQATVGGQTVNVYADGDGSIQSANAYYLWEINGDGVKEKAFVGGGFKAGTDNDYYLFDVDYDPKTADIEVYVGKDCTPATADDTYTLDVNNDGYLPYQATFTGLKAAYSKVPKYGASAQALLTSTTLEAAKAFVEAYNSGKLTNEGQYFAVESYPGLFYEVVNNKGSYGEDENEVKDLVKDIAASYDAGSDKLVINYKLRSTNNSVYFRYIPVQLNGNVVSSPVVELTGQALDAANIHHDVTCSVSIMDFPSGLGDALGTNGGVTYSAGYRGDRDINLSNDGQWYQMNGTYFSVDNAGYASGKAEWWSNVYDQQMYANIPAPRTEIADSYKLEDAAKKAKET